MTLLARLAATAAFGAAPSALDDPAFRFCHVDGANAEQAREWCALLEDLPEDRCPGLRATCAGAVTADPQGCAGADAESGTGRADGLAGAPEPPPEAWDPGCNEVAGCEAFDASGLQLLMRWIAALAVAALVAVVLRVAWTTFARRRRDRWTDPAPPPLPEALDPLDEVPDVPSDDLVSRARAALADGRHGEAVLLARAAALRRLGEAGRLRLHRSRTDREYVRAVRDDAPVHQALRAIVARVEAVRWAGRPIGREAAAEALARAEELLAGLPVRAAGGLLLLGLAFGTAPAEAQTAERFAPPGDAALLEVLELYGHEPQWRLRNLIDLDDQVDALFLDLSGVTPTPEHWARLEAWVRAGGVLVVGGDASEPFPALGERGPSAPPYTLDPAFATAGLAVPRLPGGLAAWDGEALRGLVVAEDGAVPVALLDLDLGVVVAIADERLLWNGAFVHPDNERFVGGLVHAGQSLEGWPVETPARVQLATRSSAADPEEQSQGCNNPVDAMAEAGLLAFLLQLAATWMLAGLWRGWPFAPLRDPPREGRTAFVEHLQALGTRYWRLRAGRHAARASAALWLARLGPQGLALAAQRGGYGADEARAWAARIEALARSDDDDDTPVDPALMEELWRLTRREE